nr:TauD/TfdA family dioxygenase [Duganella sp. FT27W]
MFPHRCADARWAVTGTRTGRSATTRPRSASGTRSCSYRHHWLPGDVVVADNLRVAHKATPLTADSRRILNRTTVRADGVIWQ